ncbi:MAG: helix-turn-helix transcriptional regulator [Ramlibacter sp.]|nr:helix-turn-helix transcriptional regulator [Ramlibacter sp.]
MDLVTTLFADDASPRAAATSNRTAPDPEFAWRVLEEIDYGLILVNPEGRFQHANHLARHELARARYLRIEGSTVTSMSAGQSDELARGIRSAARGRRQMLSLRQGSDRLSVACIPLFQPYEGESASVLLMLARRTGTQNLAVSFFAREHRLSPTEEAVLRSLCDGLDVLDIATAHGVCESTVRTQVRSLRDKTDSNSIRQLVQRVAALPPVVPCGLRGQSASQSAW